MAPNDKSHRRRYRVVGIVLFLFVIIATCSAAPTWERVDILTGASAQVPTKDMVRVVPLKSSSIVGREIQLSVYV